MGAYAYCDCGCGIPGPWDLTTENLLKILFIENAGIKCSRCGEEYIGYSNFTENIIESLAKRIDHIQE